MNFLWSGYMSLKEIREKNKLEDGFIRSKSKYKDVEITLSEEDREFYKVLMGLSYKAISKHLDEMENE